MKTLFIICFFFASLFYIDELDFCNTNETSKAFLGEWKLKRYQLDAPVDLNKDGSYNTDIMKEVDCLANEVLKITSNNKVVWYSSSLLELTIHKNTIEGNCEKVLSIDGLSDLGVLWYGNQSEFNLYDLKNKKVHSGSVKNGGKNIILKQILKLPNEYGHILEKEVTLYFEKY